MIFENRVFIQLACPLHSPNETTILFSLLRFLLELSFTEQNSSTTFKSCTISVTIPKLSAHLIFYGANLDVLSLEQRGEKLAVLGSSKMVVKNSLISFFPYMNLWQNF